MFGQSWLVREVAKGICEAIGAEPEIAKNIGRIAGWTVAHLTIDHHFQGAAELIDLASDNFHDDILSDTETSCFGTQLHFGSYGHYSVGDNFLDIDDSLDASYPEIHNQFEADAHRHLADEYRKLANEAQVQGNYQLAAQEMQKCRDEMFRQFSKQSSAWNLNSMHV